MKKSRLHIGISGWTYPSWKGSFYPEDLKKSEELHYASRKLSTLEVNGTFYSLQKPHTFKKWYDQVPEDFIFSIKAPQFITHVLRLRDCEEPLATFLASGLLRLEEKLGVILWQFPPYLPYKDERFEEFMKLLPHDTKTAAKIAKNHNPRFKDRVWTRCKNNTPIRHAFEMRHPSFESKKFIETCKRNQVALVYSDSSNTSIQVNEQTADFTYVRMHAEGHGHKNGHTNTHLNALKKKIATWEKKQTNSSNREFFVYFNNDEKTLSPRDALKFEELMNSKTSSSLISTRNKKAA